MVNKFIIVNKFVLHTLYRNIAHLTIMTLKTTMGGGGGKKST